MPISPVRSITTKVWGLSFDGVDDYAEVPDSPSISPTTAITLMFWMKAEAEVNMGVFVKGRSYNVQATMAVNGIWCNFWSGGEEYTIRSTDPPVYTGEWYFIAITLETPGAPTIYINGEPATAYAYRNEVPGPIDDVTNPLRIGYIYFGQNYFKGTIGPALIYERRLTSDEVLEAYRGYIPLDGLTMWLWANELLASGNVWRDRSGYGNHATIYGAVWTETSVIQYAKPTRLIAQTRLISPTR